MYHLTMKEPIWVWCYLTSEKRGQRQDRNDVPMLSVWPDVHTYAFRTEQEALAHPSKANWPKVHGYSLHRVYLQPMDDVDAPHSQAHYPS